MIKWKQICIICGRLLGLVDKEQYDVGARHEKLEECVKNVREDYQNKIDKLEAELEHLIGYKE